MIPGTSRVDTSPRQHPDVPQHVREPRLRDPVRRSGDVPAAAELGRDDDLALPLRLADEQPGAGDVDVDEVVVGAPGEHRVDHRAPLDGVVDPVHLRPRRAEAAAAARVHVDDDVREREQHGREEVRELLVGRAVRVARERAVEVDAVRPEPRVRA